MLRMRLSTAWTGTGKTAGAVRLAATALALFSTPALALPPAGIYLEDAEHLWWECHLHPVTKRGCCRASDGHVLSDNEWRAVEKAGGTRVYQVHVGTRWFDVPAQVVINDVGHCGAEPNPVNRPLAKAWYTSESDSNRPGNAVSHCFGSRFCR
jgi:hypothetical protein